MAYLKGNTYVSGDLYVEGTLKVQRLADSSNGNLPYLETDEAAINNRLVKFTSNDGSLNSSAVSENVVGADQIIYAIETQSESVTLNTNTDNFSLFTDISNLSDADLSSSILPKFDVETKVAYTQSYDSEVVLLKKDDAGTITLNGKKYSVWDETNDRNKSQGSTRTSSPDAVWYKELI